MTVPGFDGAGTLVHLGRVLNGLLVETELRDLPYS